MHQFTKYLNGGLIDYSSIQMKPFFFRGSQWRGTVIVNWENFAWISNFLVKRMRCTTSVSVVDRSFRSSFPLMELRLICNQGFAMLFDVVSLKYGGRQIHSSRWIILKLIWTTIYPLHIGYMIEHLNKITRGIFLKYFLGSPPLIRRNLGVKNYYLSFQFWFARSNQFIVYVIMLSLKVLLSYHHLFLMSIFKQVIGLQSELIIVSVRIDSWSSHSSHIILKIRCAFKIPFSILYLYRIICLSQQFIDTVF